MGTKVNTIALLIGVAMTATACGGGGSGSGKVSVATATVDTAVVVTEPTNGGILAESSLDSPMNDNLALVDLRDDFDANGVPTANVFDEDYNRFTVRVDGDLLQDVENAHAQGYTGEGFDVYTTDGQTGITEAIAPDANALELVSNDALNREVNDNDDFVGGIVTPEGDSSDYISFQSGIGAYEASAAAVIWDKFDSASGSDLETHINNTRKTTGELDVSAALAPAGLVR